ncbi:hypothetical protein OHA21_45145 [Actinoplanes sp. NBC_00393]|uniref:hypothetical protein n=1 Tax=Actinoplanes sp. NBC_00393 TaxID=2975953 RepID=UPI002E20C74F
MEKTAGRTSVLRSFPVLLALLLALLGAPVQATASVPGQSAGPVVSSVISDDAAPRAASAEVSDAVTRTPESHIPDLTRALRTQLFAGVAGSRAPPSAA